jgi:TonB family protein
VAKNIVLGALFVGGLVVSTLAVAQQLSATADAAHSIDVQAALSAYRQNKYQSLLKLVLPLAVEGDPGPRTLLGLAALADDPDAEQVLGTLYFQGRVGGMRNPVVGYALSSEALNHRTDPQEREAIHATLGSERRSMTPDQITQARVLADEIQRVGLLSALRDYLGDSAAERDLCQIPSGPNICHESHPGAPPLLFTVDAQGLILHDGSEQSHANLQSLMMLTAIRAPQSEIVVTVDSTGPLAAESVQSFIAEARNAGIALVTVVPGPSLDSVPGAGSHHLSFILADAVPGPDGADIPAVPPFVVAKFSPDRQPVLVWLDPQGKVTAVRLDTRYPVTKPDVDAVEKASRFSYEPCLQGDVGAPCFMEVWVPTSAPLQLDAIPGHKHELAIVAESVLTRTSPSYPAAAISALHEGTVTLLVHVSSKGLPMEISLINTSGYQELDDAARNAVTNWTFRPRTIEGVPIDSYFKVPVAFSLNRSQNKADASGNKGAGGS